MEGLSQIAPCMSLHASLRTLLPQMPCAQDGLKIQIHPHGHIPLYSQTPLFSNFPTTPLPCSRFLLTYWIIFFCFTFFLAKFRNSCFALRQYVLIFSPAFSPYPFIRFTSHSLTSFNNPTSLGYLIDSGNTVAST